MSTQSDQSDQVLPAAVVVCMLAWSLLIGTALVAFIVLKLAGVINWSWWWVLTPLGVIPFQILLSAVLGVLNWTRYRWLSSRRPEREVKPGT